MVVWGGQPKVRAPAGQLRSIRGLYQDARVGSQPKSENGFLDSGVFLLRNSQVPTRGWSLVLLGPLKIENWPPYGRFGHTLDFRVTTERAKCFPVRLKSFGSVFSSFLSYILVLDVSWLFGGVSLRFGPLRANFGPSGASTETPDSAHSLSRKWGS